MYYGGVLLDANTCDYCPWQSALDWAMANAGCASIEARDADGNWKAVM